MATSPYFFQSFRDPATDEPADGGKVHIYAQGSAVHANIWLDAAETVPAPNPLTLDPAGVVQQYFVTDGQALDYKVFTSDGRIIVTALNVTANGNSSGGEGGPFLPLAGEKRVTGWVAFDATVYGTLIDMSVFNLTQSGLELKTGTRVYGGGSLSVESSAYFYDPRALTLSIDSMGTGPGGVAPINSTHLVGRDPVTGLLVPVEADGPFHYFPRNFPEDAPPSTLTLDTWYISSETPTGPWAASPDTIWHYTAAGTWESFAPFDGQQVLLGNRNLYRYSQYDTPKWQFYATDGPVTRAFNTNISAARVSTPLVNNLSGDFRWEVGDTYGLRLGDSAGVYGSLSRQGLGTSRMFSDLAGNAETIIDVVGITTTEPAATNYQQWLIGTGATGAFAGKGGQVACWTPANYPNPAYWLYFTPADGAMIRIGSTIYRKSGGTLVNFNLQGTTTNDSAPAGCVGELLSSIVAIGAHVSLVTVVAKDVTTLELPAGDWDVWAALVIDIGSGPQTIFPGHHGSVSLTANTLDPIFSGACPQTNGVGPINIAPAHRPVSVAAGATVTVHMVARSAFSSSSCYAYGNLYARRVR